MNRYIECGTVVSAHGIKGELKAAGDAEIIVKARTVAIGEGKTEYHVLSARIHKNTVLLRLEGITDMDTAEKLRGKTVFADRNGIELPEGVYFRDDILGLDVFDNTGKSYGKITEICSAGPTDVYTATDSDGTERMFPAVKSSGIIIDLEAHTLVFTPLEGLFD